MAIQEFFTGRNNGIPTGNTYVGQDGRLWYDPTTNTIRVYNGDPGGLIVSGGGGGGGAANVTVQYQGANLTTALSVLDFVGEGVLATNVGDDVTVNIPGPYFIFDGGAPDQTYLCGPLPARIGDEWDGSNCIDLGTVT